MKNQMKISEARVQNLCPKCLDQGTIMCGAERGVRCGICEELKRMDPGYEYGEVLPLEHVCDDCAGIGTFDAYKIYCGFPEKYERSS